MKKVTSILLAIMLLAGLTACGGQQDSTTAKEGSSAPGSTSQEQTQGQNPDQTTSQQNPSADPAAADWWVVDDSINTDYPFPDLNISTKQVGGSETSVQIAQTDLFHDFDQAVTQARAIQLVSDNYNLGRQSAEYENESATYTGLGHYVSFRWQESLVGIHKAKDDATSQSQYHFNDFELTYLYDTSEFEGPYLARINLADLQLTPAVQDQVYELALCIFNEDLAKLVVYGKDRDGLGSSNLTIEAGAFYESYEASDGTIYTVIREFGQATNDGSRTVTLSVYVDDVPFQNKFNCYSDGYEPLLKEFPYLPNAFFGGDIGDDDLTHNSFANKYLSIYEDYDLTSINSFHTKRFIADDGRERYDLSFYISALQRGFKMGADYFVQLKNGEVNAIDLKLDSYTVPPGSGVDTVTAYQQQLEQIRHQYRCITGQELPVTWDDMVQNAENAKQFYNKQYIDLTLAGKTTSSGYLTISFDEDRIWDGQWTLDISFHDD